MSVIKAFAESERKRDSYFVTTKIEGGLNFTRTLQEHEQNLSDLQLDKVDLLLVHFPCLIPDIKGSKEMRQDQVIWTKAIFVSAPKFVCMLRQKWRYVQLKILPPPQKKKNVFFFFGGGSSLS